MKNILPVFVLGLLAVPALFNSCQGGFKAKGSVASLSSVSCKVTLENGGQLSKVSHSYLEQPSPFRDSKLVLDLSNSDQSFQKASGESVIAKGSSLSAIYRNSCIVENLDDKTERLWTLIDPKSELEPLEELINQAYDWELERDYSTREIETLIANDSCVLGVSWNQRYSAESSTFNDPEAYQQGHLASIRALEAYNKAYGGNINNAASLTTQVKVAVIDSGVDWKHPDLQSNFWAHSLGWGFDATSYGAGGAVNFNPFDVAPNGHGTHIAGLIGGVSNNSLGIIGTMPVNARIMAIKIFKLNNSNELETNSTYLYNGLQFALINGAEVLNLSLMATGASYDAVFDAAISDALGRGAVVVGAMGNGSPGQLVNGTSLSVVPAIFSVRQGVMAVGSFDSSTNQKSEFSHYGTAFAEISAPGAEQGTYQGVFSTLPTHLGGYGRLAGTSQSTAIVSGAAALTIALIKKAYGNSPSPAEVERLILSSARKNSNLASFFKDGNQLDLASLIDRVHADYPNTKLDTGADPIPCW